jgi:hypothetical protein
MSHWEHQAAIDRYELREQVEQAAERLQAVSASLTLCERCRHAHIWKRLSERESGNYTVYCQMAERLVPPDIIECNRFKSVNELDLDQLSKIAHIIEHRESGNEEAYL